MCAPRGSRIATTAVAAAGAATRGSGTAIIGESCAPQTRTQSFPESSTTKLFSSASSARSWSRSAAPRRATLTFSRTVTLSIDGKETQVRTFGDNVGEVLASKGIEPTSHDSVVPGVDSPVNDGSRIAVRLGRPLALSIDGDKRTLWTTATKVAGALDQLGVRFGNAALSVSRSATSTAPAWPSR